MNELLQRVLIGSACRWRGCISYDATVVLIGAPDLGHHSLMRESAYLYFMPSYYSADEAENALMARSLLLPSEPRFHARYYRDRRGQVLHFRADPQASARIEELVVAAFFNDAAALKGYRNPLLIIGDRVVGNVWDLVQALRVRSRGKQQSK